MFSQTVEYALRAMIYLAQSSGKPQPTEEIAKVTKVPPAYLSKVLQSMSKGGLVISQRGLHGGFRLAKKPEEVNILDIISSVDPIERIQTCPLGLKSHGVHLCPLHRRVDNAMAEVEKTLSASTLAELLAEPTDSIPLYEAGTFKPS
ncbi:MAG: Rrf2 family transcriptional regulator [Planctomycetaceae bacterium]|jgi:Rrf2 family transcriptional regulator, nitric oxide-sensitive transcriptional repressor|nr:Rrf2 family transcriptional regulator [Planctomycetaceae bacterium]